MCCGIDLICTQLDFKSTPLSVRQFDDGIDFPAQVILIVVQRTAEGFRIDFQVALAQCLEQEAQGLQIPQQTGRGHFQQRTGQGRIGEVPLHGLLHTDGGADTGGEGGLIVEDEQTLEDIQIILHGVDVDVLVIHFPNVIFQGSVRDGGAFVPSQGAQQQAHLGSVPLDAVDTVDIIINDGVQIFRRKQRSLLHGKIDSTGLSAADDQLDQLLQFHFTGHGGFQLTVAQLLKGHLAGGVAGFVQGHGAHPELGDPTCSAVENPFVVGRGGAGEDELSFPGSLIHTVTHSIPNRGDFRPFVNQARCIAVEYQFGGQLCQLAILEITSGVANVDRTVAVIGRCPCLAAPSGSLHADSTEDLQVFLDLGVDKTGNFVNPMLC